MVNGGNWGFGEFDNLEELLADMRSRLVDSVATPARLRELLEAVLVVGAGLELDSILQRIVQAATTLLDARYGALGVRDPDGGLSEFVYEGITAEERARMGHLPEGHGLLGLLMEHPRPVRVAHLGAHPASVGFPPNHPPMDSFLGMPIIVRGRVFGSIYLTEKRTGPEFTDEDETILDALATSAGVAIDNAHLFEESRTRERWLTALASSNARLLSGGSIDEALELLVTRTRDLCGATGAYVLVVEDEDDAIVEAASRGDGPRPGSRIDLSDSGLLPVVRGRRPALLTERDRVAPFATGSDVRVAALPLSTTSGVAGMLVVTREGLGWAPDEITRLGSMADSAALAVEFADQQHRRRQLDVLADRDRIARDLHDNVIQQLFATGMSLQSLLLDENAPVPESASGTITKSVSQLDRMIHEIRTTIFDLQTTGEQAPTSLRRRLLDAIGDLTTRSVLVPNVQFTGAIDTLVPPRIHPHAEAVLREGLSNALRHADATTITVAIDAADHLTIRICDDGVGLPETTRRSGLDNLARRAEQCGGSCALLPGLSGGTELTWRVPLR
ncbi:GAF domain-containing protein [Rhodococcus sp. TAF43]|uniref:sensor histidine kinase n=1 Tax=unclassified Rhodococcus (in: high G+C Gram-positive bacteria) TaxID=192944 RepID=UPI001581AA05|nr:GAF domain-containing protein [Rhodococcus sp. W8901]QKT10453.1 GAF domain-containing protein [Rhodococcus sp. W8901]